MLLSIASSVGISDIFSLLIINNLGENRELDLIQWMHRFTNEITFIIATGVKNNSVFSYYSTFIPENSFNEEEN